MRPQNSSAVASSVAASVSSHQQSDPRALHKQLLSALPVGHSFFIEDAVASQLSYLRRLGYSLQIRLAFRQVIEDEIYCKPGVRVKRVA